MKRLNIVSLAALAGALGCTPAAAAPQAFVASGGSDLNARFDCSASRPCRTFAAAMAVVDSGGDVVAVDPGAYGAVAITKSVSLVGSGYAAVAAITIAAPDIDVVLRGLQISGDGSPAAANGVSMSAGRSLTMERSVVSNFFAHGILVETAADLRILDSTLRGNENGARIRGGARADFVRTQFIGNRGAGLLLDANTDEVTRATVTDSVATGNATGFHAGSSHATGLGRVLVTGSTASNNVFAGFLTSASHGTSVMTVGHSTATGNGTGFAWIPGVAGVGVFESMGDNTVRHNGQDVSPFLTITTVARM